MIIWQVIVYVIKVKIFLVLVCKKDEWMTVEQIVAYKRVF